MGLSRELSAWHRRKSTRTYQVLKRREEESELGRVSRNRHGTVCELLFGRLCADSNGIGKEVSLVPTDLCDYLGDGLWESIWHGRTS